MVLHKEMTTVPTAGAIVRVTWSTDRYQASHKRCTDEEAGPPGSFPAASAWKSTPPTLPQPAPLPLLLNMKNTTKMKSKRPLLLISVWLGQALAVLGCPWALLTGGPKLPVWLRMERQTDWVIYTRSLSLSLFPTRSPASVAVVTSPKASWPRSPWMERVSSGRTKSRTTTTRNGAATRTAWTNPPQKHRDVCLQVLGWKQPLRHRCAPKTSQVSPMLLF